MNKGTKRQRESKPEGETGRTTQDDLKKALSNFGNLGELVRNALDAAEKIKENLTELSQNDSVKDDIRANFSFNVRTAAGRSSSPLSNRQPAAETRAHKGRAEMDDVREPVIDIFDEGDHFMLVVELPGVAESSVTLELHEDILALTAQSVDCIFQQETLLPAPVEFKARTQRLHNGVLEVKLPKRNGAG